MTEMNCSSSYSNEDIQAVPQLFYQALSQVMQHADITLMLELWSEQDDITYCDPGIHLHLGRSALASYWQRAADANRSSPAKITSTAEPAIIHQYGNCIYTVMIEHVQIKEDNTIKNHLGLGTNIYRHEGDRWRMIHRHSGPLRDEDEATTNL